MHVFINFKRFAASLIKIEISKNPRWRSADIFLTFLSWKASNYCVRLKYFLRELIFAIGQIFVSFSRL